MVACGSSPLRRLLSYELPSAPDGGLFGWGACAATFVIFAVVVGLESTFGQLMAAMLADEGLAGGTRTSLSFVGSAAFFLELFLGLAVSRATDVAGTRAVCLAGALCTGGGLFLSASATSVAQLYLTFSVLAGTGLALAYGGASIALMQYFTSNAPAANAFAGIGAGVGVIVLAQLIDSLIESAGWRGCLRALGVLAAASMGAAAIFYVPVATAEAEDGAALDGGDAAGAGDAAAIEAAAMKGAAGAAAAPHAAGGAPPPRVQTLTALGYMQRSRRSDAAAAPSAGADAALSDASADEGGVSASLPAHLRMRMTVSRRPSPLITAATGHAAPAAAAPDAPGAAAAAPAAASSTSGGEASHRLPPLHRGGPLATALVASGEVSSGSPLLRSLRSPALTAATAAAAPSPALRPAAPLPLGGSSSAASSPPLLPPAAAPASAMTPLGLLAAAPGASLGYSVPGTPLSPFVLGGGHSAASSAIVGQVSLRRAAHAALQARARSGSSNAYGFVGVPLPGVAAAARSSGDGGGGGGGGDGSLEDGAVALAVGADAAAAGGGRGSSSHSSSSPVVSSGDGSLGEGSAGGGTPPSLCLEAPPTGEPRAATPALSAAAAPGPASVTLPAAAAAAFGGGDDGDLRVVPHGRIAALWQRLLLHLWRGPRASRRPGRSAGVDGEAAGSAAVASSAAAAERAGSSAERAAASSAAASVWRDPRFWALALCLALLNSAMTVPETHLGAAVEDAGLPAALAADCYAAMGASAIVARLVLGSLALYYELDQLLLLQLCGVGTGLAMMALAPYSGSAAVLLAFSLVFGALAGAAFSLAAPVLATLFGAEALPYALGGTFSFRAPFVLLAAPIAGAAREAAGSYTIVWVAAGMLCVASALPIGVMGCSCRRTARPLPSLAALLPQARRRRQSQAHAPVAESATSAR